MLIYAAYLLIWALTVSPILTVLFYHFRMYRRFADAEFPGCSPHCGFMLYDILGKRQDAFLNISVHKTPPNKLYTAYEGVPRNMTNAGALFRMQRMHKLRWHLPRAMPARTLKAWHQWFARRRSKASACCLLLAGREMHRAGFVHAASY